MLKIKLGNKNNCGCGFTCEGCQEDLYIEIDFECGFDWSDARKVAHDIGWRRRKFHDSVEPWFCSDNCAQNSARSKELENYWTSRGERWKTWRSLFQWRSK